MKVNFNGKDYNTDNMTDDEKKKLLDEMAFAKAAKEAGSISEPGYIDKFSKAAGGNLKKAGQWVEDNPMLGTAACVATCALVGVAVYRTFGGSFTE